MNNAQKIKIEMFSNDRYEVTKISDHECFASVIVETKEKHPLVKEHFQLFVGKRGGIRVVSAYRMGDDEKHMKVITSSMGNHCTGKSLKLNPL